MKLSPSEELILRAIAHREMYGLQISNALLECCNRAIGFASLYPSLRKLESKKAVTSRWGDESGDKESPRRRYYKLTELGQSEVKKIEAGFKNLKNWKG